MKMNDNKLHIALLVTAILMMAVSFCATYFYKTPSNPPKTDTVTRVDTFWKDTIIYKDKIKPVPKIVEVVKHDTITKDTVLTTERKYYQETFYMKNDTATVGIVTTGINTEIDSVSVLLKTRRPTIVNTVEITKYVEKEKTFWDRFHFGLQGGIGYGLTNKKCDIYIGVGGSYDL